MMIIIISLQWVKDRWRPLSLSELTPIIFNMMLTHLGLEASISELIISEVGKEFCH